jgi:glyoxylase-like metal-dependent hydrolase (beta-lactamase superfamily II)
LIIQGDLLLYAGNKEIFMKKKHGNGRAVKIMPNLWYFKDTCNVYVFNFAGHGIAIDFGSGKWLNQLPAIGVSKLDHVLLTHHHADQCSGLLRRKSWPFIIHAPSGEDQYLSPGGVRSYYRAMAKMNYTPYFLRSTIPRGIRNVSYDISQNTEKIFNGHCFRFVLTPGHGPNALTIIVEHGGRQLAFCGDAVFSGGKIWEPYQLEWDHWTGKGTLAAWEGITRLSGIGTDIICPSHGPLIAQKPCQVLNALSKRLLDFYRAKGSICAGEKDRFLIGAPTASGAIKILPHLYLLRNGYVLISDSKKALVVDPTIGEINQLEALLKELKCVRPEAAIVSHYHLDHCDGIPYLQRRYGVQAWIHPRVAEKISGAANDAAIYRSRMAVKPDHILPQRGKWQWREYEFSVAPWPGQTWWHAVYQAEVDGRKVLFGGDSFQPASRWNGTGGFCALNNSRLRAGFIPSARLALRWRPDIVASGHGCVYYFTRSRFQRIIKWAYFAERALRAICPTGYPAKDYYAVLGSHK